MQRKSHSRKLSKSAPRIKSISSRAMLSQSQAANSHKSKTKPHKMQPQHPSEAFNSEYYQHTMGASIKPKSIRSNSSQRSQRPTSSSSRQRTLVSTRILNQLTSRINLLWDELSLKSQKILGMRLDKTFLQIQILNNQADIHRAQKNHKGSFAAQSIYNMNKQVLAMRGRVKAADTDYDNLISYQRFLTRELEGGADPSNLRSQVSEYSSKEKLSTEFMNAVQELRILQTSLEKHNQVYQPYMAKLRRQINIQKESIGDKEQEIKHVNEAIFTHYGKNVRKSKDQMSTSSRNSLSSSTRRRNDVQVFYCGNVAVKNRSKVISDKKLLDRVDVTLSGLRTVYDPQLGFALQCLYTDQHGEVCQGQIHCSGLQPDLQSAPSHQINDIDALGFQFRRKINTISVSMLDGTRSDLGSSQAHAQRKELKLEDKVLQCVSTYWQQGALIGVGVEFLRRKKSLVDSLTSQYFG